MSVIYGNGGHDIQVDARLEWAMFESFPECIRDVLRNAGIKVSALEISDRIERLRDLGKTDAEIVEWLETAIKAMTHTKYAQAGHPQPK